MHKLLARQLKRAFGAVGDDPAKEVADRLAADAAARAGFVPFVAAVEDVYTQSDRDLELSRRSLALSTEEASAANAELHRDAARTAKVLASLRHTVRDLVDDPSALEGAHQDDVVALTEMVARLVREREEVRERQRIREERLELAVASTDDGLWDWALHTGEVYASPRCAEMLGWASTALAADIGSWVRLFHPEEREGAQAALFDNLRARSERFERELRMETGSGAWRWMLVRGKVFARDASGRALRMVGTLHDVTERREVAAHLLRAKEAAEATSRAKSEFLANVSHEIRTPMNAIIGLTELTLDTLLSREQREYVVMVRTSGEALLTIINDILDFSKMEAEKLVLDRIEFSLRGIVNEACRIVAGRAHAKGLELTCRIATYIPDRLEGDPGRLRQVLLNLLGNAVKFTATGEVALDVALLARAGDQLELSLAVRDTGPGIAADKLSTIFEAFAQADNSITRQFGGTGLGLTIAARLAALMGGGVTVQSQPGVGSCFTFTARFGITSRPRVSEQMKPLHGVRILAVDANATNRAVYGQLLDLWGAEVTLGASGSDVLAQVDAAAVQGRPYTLLLLEDRMPGMDGTAIAEALRRRPGRPSVVLAMAQDRAVDGAALKALNVHHWVTRPVSAPVLLESLVGCLGSAGAVSTEPEGPAPLPQRLPPRREGAASLRVLLVEDNEVNQLVAVRLLEKLGHSVVVARNGREGVATWSRERFDVVLMDVQMPDMDGIEATRALREAEAARGGRSRTPVIALTAHAMASDRERCLAAGMDHYVTKPIRVESLAAIIDEAVAAARSPSPAASPLDEEALLASLGGDVELAVQISEMFFEESAVMLGAVREQWERRSFDELKSTVHALKGALATFEAAPAIEVAKRLESVLRRGDVTSVTEADIASLETETKRVVEALRDFVARHGAGGNDWAETAP